MIQELGLQQLIALFVEGFEVLRKAGQIMPQELQLQKLELLNDTTLVAFIVASSQDSIGVKTDACTTMGAMVGFFKEDLALPENIKNLGVRAFTDNGEELMYVLSSVEVARFCSEGRSIEWLTNSLFVENTPDYRRARANLLVFRIEIGLRRIITLRLDAAIGSNWWASIARSIRNSSDRAMRQEAARGTATGTPIDYTFLLQLKDIVLAFWPELQDIFRDQGRFEQAMTDLNAIRRPEAHNRVISESQIKVLEGIYEQLSGAMVAVDSESVPSFLVENWRSRLAEIFHETAHHIPDIQEKDKAVPGLVRRKFDVYVKALNSALYRIRSVVVPPGKADIHSRIERTWTDLCLAAASIRELADQQDMAALTSASVTHERLYDELNALATEHLMCELGHC